MDFDGKKSTTLVGKNRTEKIEHYTCTSRGKYLDNFSLPIPKKIIGKNGKEKNEKIEAGKIIAMELHEILKKHLAKLSLIYIRADSCATNTG